MAEISPARTSEPGCWLYNRDYSDERLILHFRHLQCVLHGLSAACQHDWATVPTKDSQRGSQGSTVDRRRSIKLAAVFPFPCTDERLSKESHRTRDDRFRGNPFELRLEDEFVNLLEHSCKWLSASDFDSLVLAPTKGFIDVQIEQLKLGITRTIVERDLREEGDGPGVDHQVEDPGLDARVVTESQNRKTNMVGLDNKDQNARTDAELFVVEAAEEISILLEDTSLFTEDTSSPNSILFDVAWIPSPGWVSGTEMSDHAVTPANPSLTLSLPVSLPKALPLYGSLLEVKRRYSKSRITIWCPSTVEGVDLASREQRGAPAILDAGCTPNRVINDEKSVEADASWGKDGYRSQPTPMLQEFGDGKDEAEGKVPPTCMIATSPLILDQDSWSSPDIWQEWCKALSASYCSRSLIDLPPGSASLWDTGHYKRGRQGITTGLLWRGKLEIHAQRGRVEREVMLDSKAAAGTAAMTGATTLAGVALVTQGGMLGVLSYSCAEKLAASPVLRMVTSIPFAEAASVCHLLAECMPTLRLVVEDPELCPGTMTFLKEWSTRHEAFILAGTGQVTRTGAMDYHREEISFREGWERWGGEGEGVKKQECGVLDDYILGKLLLMCYPQREQDGSMEFAVKVLRSSSDFGEEAVALLLGESYERMKQTVSTAPSTSKVKVSGTTNHEYRKQSQSCVVEYQCSDPVLFEIGVVAGEGGKVAEEVAMLKGTNQTVEDDNARVLDMPGVPTSVARMTRSKIATTVSEVLQLPVYQGLNSVKEEAVLLEEAQHCEKAIAEIIAMASSLTPASQETSRLSSGRQRSRRQRMQAEEVNKNGDPQAEGGEGDDKEHVHLKKIFNMVSARAAIWASFCNTAGLTSTQSDEGALLSKIQEGLEAMVRSEVQDQIAADARSIYGSFGTWGVDSSSLGWAEECLLPTCNRDGGVAGSQGGHTSVQTKDGGNEQSGNADGIGLKRRLSTAEEVLQKAGKQEKERARERRLVAKEQQARIDDSRRLFGVSGRQYSQGWGTGVTRGGRDGEMHGLKGVNASLKGGRGGGGGSIGGGGGGGGGGMKGRRMRSAPLVRAASLPKLARGSLIHGKLAESFAQEASSSSGIATAKAKVASAGPMASNQRLPSSRARASGTTAIGYNSKGRETGGIGNRHHSLPTTLPTRRSIITSVNLGGRPPKSPRIESREGREHDGLNSSNRSVWKDGRPVSGKGLYCSQSMGPGVGTRRGSNSRAVAQCHQSPSAHQVVGVRRDPWEIDSEAVPPKAGVIRESGNPEMEPKVATREARLERPPRRILGNDGGATGMAGEGREGGGGGSPALREVMEKAMRSAIASKMGLEENDPRVAEIYSRECPWTDRHR